MKTTILIASLLVLALVGCSSKVNEPTSTSAQPTSGGASDTAIPVAFTNDKGQVVCPVSGDVVTVKGSYQDYNGKRYYFCCDDCPPKFKANPQKYAEGKAIKSGEAKSMGG